MLGQPAPSLEVPAWGSPTHKLRLPSPEEALPGRDRADAACPTTHFVNGAPLEPPFPAGLQRARVFGMGCFWGAERKFWQTPGVFSTSGRLRRRLHPNPTYEEVCSGRTGHAEVVRVVFDPKRVSYEELLRVFWESHDPTQGMRQGNDVGTQYRSAIYAYGDEQRRRAEASRDAYQRALDAAGHGPDHHRDPRRRRSSTTPRTITSSTWRRTRTATAASAAPASSCPVGLRDA